jgi:protein arginine kinase activator
MHAGVRHQGKIPAGSKSRVDFEQTIELARKELQDAVEREDFEKAAELRDKLQGMENDAKTIA